MARFYFTLKISTSPINLTGEVNAFRIRNSSGDYNLNYNYRENATDDIKQ